MYLKLKKEVKETPKDFFLNCPYSFQPKDINTVFSCINCKDPPCLKVCKQKAIYFSTNNIVSIDLDLCNGCGDCLKACPHLAIIIRNKKAYKCDLCSNSSFSMFCYKNNPKYLELVESIDDSTKKEIINKYLGYMILNDYKTIKNYNKEIIQDLQNKKRYIIPSPNLSLDEVYLVNSILDNYKVREEKVKLEETLKIKDEIEEELINFCYKNNLELDQEQYDYILDATYNNLHFFGPLTYLLNDKNLEEIAIIGINKAVYVYHRNFGWLETNLMYISESILKELVNKLAWSSNKYITLKNPILDTYLEDNSRVNAIINPITESCSVTIRKFSQKPFTIHDLVKFNTISKEALSFLSLVFLTDSNVFVVGNTGSGKTTTLNVFLSFVPDFERFVVVEDVREIRLNHKHKIFTLVNQELGITLDSLVINTLRMRPDRVVIGEVRSKEDSKSLIESMLCGQAKGTYSTFHAQSVNDSLLRLKSYGILESDLGVVDIIICQRRYNSYRKDTITDLRTIFEISEVIFEKNKLRLNVLYEYDINKEKLVKKNESIKIFNKLKLSFGIKSLVDLRKLIKNKEKELFK
ncbi:MAG: ATPase, T2SS/T4P/T4SS family [Candidatus ainarchaeum sp.]|nr:ATPase, T2SS/T4P/T4SS family [Candidatus ainarchaeum sp.]MDD4220991.1 ATPase, T2SS/T4P/T4SS family [Candidatus ainarchaeum sp.]MDD4662437.1 ATPase, T2SS/T4P/T4SS family [Candidatus ainarchaeum sp.]